MGNYTIKLYKFIDFLCTLKPFTYILSELLNAILHEASDYACLVSQGIFEFTTVCGMDEILRNELEC